jgi:tetratricopeptide (TPR) repeat protein
LALNHRDLDALHRLGLTLLQQGSPGEAVALLQDVAEQRPNATTLNDLAGALKAVGLLQDAHRQLQTAIQLDPACIQPRFNLGVLQLELGQDQDALKTLRQVATLDPEFPAAAPTLAQALLRAGNAAYAEGNAATAEHLYREALVRAPNFIAALGNLANALTRQARLDEALPTYARALALAPANSDIEFAYSLALLLNGDFEAGWRHYEARFDVAPMRWNYDRRHDLSRWRPGMSLFGRCILLMAEQGSGDIVQFARFVPILAKTGIRVVLELPTALRPLFQELQVEQIIALDDPTPPSCDLALPLLSLPLALGTTLSNIPANIPYIHVPQDRLTQWATWLGPRTSSRRVGLVCSGDPRHPHDSLRSIPLRQMEALLATPNHEFILVQPDIRASDQPLPPNLSFPAAALSDFGDVAALLSHCDIIITVDTAAAHIAGALGLPAWVLLPYSPDYRWLLERSDSPWYPAIRLYRQPQPGAWDMVIDTIRRDLTRE